MRVSLSSGATSAVACLLAALAGKGFAQSPSEPEPSGSAPQRLSAYRERAEVADLRLEEIREEELTNGPYSPALIDQLQGLALIYQEIGRGDLAVESMEKALQVERANFGLFSLDQVPLIEQLIAAERARGDADAVAELERRLLDLAHKHPNDLRSMEILQDAGDRQLELYGLYLAGNAPPQLSISIGFVSSTRSPLAGWSVARAQGHYRDAIGVLLRNESYGHEALRGLERRLLYTYYLELTRTEPRSQRVDAISILGTQAHERLVAYETLNGGSLEDIARALVALADWELLFSQNGTAIDRYREVYAMLAREDGYEGLLAELFTPDTPVVLPAFVPNPLVSRARTDENENYVDIAFEISRYGRGRAIDVLATSGETAKDESRDLIRLISRGRFRPIFRDGEPVPASPAVVRYRF